MTCASFAPCRRIEKRSKVMLVYQKPMFSEDGERRPLLTEEELHDACLHNAATIVIAFVLGCEFKDCQLTDDGYKWPTSLSRIELEYPEDWRGKAEALSSVVSIHEAGAMAVAKLIRASPRSVRAPIEFW
jgi:hypothetical protein